jgi:hypothetical protein
MIRRVDAAIPRGSPCQHHPEQWYQQKDDYYSNDVAHAAIDRSDARPACGTPPHSPAAILPRVIIGIFRRRASRLRVRLRAARFGRARDSAADRRFTVTK